MPDSLYPPLSPETPCFATAKLGVDDKNRVERALFFDAAAAAAAALLGAAVVAAALKDEHADVVTS